jgi:hypothetical protein
LVTNEPSLILAYNLETGTLVFSYDWNEWLNSLDKPFKDFIYQFNQIVIQDCSIIQKIYFCKKDRKILSYISIFFTK